MSQAPGGPWQPSDDPRLSGDPQQWQPPQYPAPGYPGYPMVRPTNTMAVLSLIMAFVFAPAGLVLGIIARRQIRQTGEQGDGLALAGAIIGGIGTAFVVLGFLLVFLVAAGGSLMMR